MWQVSDYALPDIVQAVSPLCSQPDRTYSVRYLGGTMMGMSSWYDPDGTYHLCDPNTNKYEVWCSCGRKWHVWSSGNINDEAIKIDNVTEVDPHSGLEEFK